MINFIIWIVLGFVAGYVAKLIMPGPDGGGFILTTILGIVGAFVGGFIGNQFLAEVPILTVADLALWDLSLPLLAHWLF